MDWLVEDEDTTRNQRKPWRVVIVDDDEEVHKVTKLAMKTFEFQGRALEFISAYSGEEAKRLIATEQDIAVILLDVVMETDDAGLRLVNYIRSTLANKTSRIVLRTGQAGLAPESEVIRDYDIDGYKSKTEITKDSLNHLFYVALRSYRDICRINNYKNGLRALINTVLKIDRFEDINAFAKHLLRYLCEVLDAYEAELVVNNKKAVAINIKTQNNDLINTQDAELSKPAVQTLIDQAIETRSIQYHANFVAVHQRFSEDIESVVVLEVDSELDANSIDLVNIFAEHVSVLISKVN